MEFPATALGKAPRLIASDIDGTFLDPNHRVSPRLREVVMRAVNSGTYFALATGRPHRWISQVLEQLPIRPLCVTSNGAVTYDTEQDCVIRAVELAPETMADIVATAREVMADHGGIAVAAERAGRTAHDPLESLYVVDQTYADNTEWGGYGLMPSDSVFEEPAVKLMLRSINFSSSELYDLIAPHVDPEAAHVTYSMPEGLLEIAAPGVTKATGVAELASRFRLDAADTVVFGDMPNDIEMIQWAGLGVAMGNAEDAVKDVADFVTAPNSEAGVAQVLERWF